MKKYSSKRAKKGKVAFRMSRTFIFQKLKEITKRKSEVKKRDAR